MNYINNKIHDLISVEQNKSLISLREETKQLRSALSQKTGETFENYLIQAKEQIDQKHKMYKARLLELNGAYYQDPLSLLKRAWDAAVRAIASLLGGATTTREKLEEQNKALLGTNRTEIANPIDEYFKLEKERNACIELLQQTLFLRQGSLDKRKNELEARQLELCGHYYADPKGLLDQAWRCYSAAGQETELKTYQQLDQERQWIEIQLSILQKGASSHENPIFALAQQNMENRLQELEKTIEQISLKNLHPGTSADQVLNYDL